MFCLNSVIRLSQLILEEIELYDTLESLIVAVLFNADSYFLLVYLLFFYFILYPPFKTTF